MLFSPHSYFYLFVFTYSRIFNCFCQEFFDFLSLFRILVFFTLLIHYITFAFYHISAYCFYAYFSSFLLF